MPRGKPKEDYITRQENRVNRNGKENELIGRCHEWTGAMHPNGYGYVNPPDESGNKGKMISTHRWFYEIRNGEIPEGKMVRHKCDNRICCNPDHLELGESIDNVRDMLKRNPKACGRKLSFDDIKNIKERRDKGELIQDLAKEYKVSRVTIRKVIQGKHIIPENIIIP